MPGKEIFTRGKSRNACFTEKRVSLLSFPTVGHVLSDPLSLVNDQFLSHCSALVASECSTSCYHFQNTYLNWAQKFDIGWNRDRLLSSALRVPTLQKCVNFCAKNRQNGIFLCLHSWFNFQNECGRYIQLLTWVNVRSFEKNISTQIYCFTIT